MSDLEDLLYAQIIDAGLPEPIREWVFAKSIGRRWRFDFSYPEQLVAIEVEGGAWSGGRHTRGGGFEGDLEKYAQATAMGWRVLRVGSKLIKSGDAVALLSLLLTRLSSGEF